MSKELAHAYINPPQKNDNEWTEFQTPQHRPIIECIRTWIGWLIWSRHVEEECEAAAVRAHDLQVERQDLDHQKQMLEEEQEAFKSALKKWAPGLGAGQFLSKSISRKEQ